MHRHYSIYALLLAAILLMAVAPSVAAAKKSDNFTVIIDAGHGGKDVGATDNGVKEKDINLGVALKLGDLIKKHLKGVKVVYTRDDDTFVTLQGRAEKANKSKGDLFISIHTNSVDASNKNRRSVCGSSVYVLGLHKDEENMDVARRENAVIELEANSEERYSGFDPNSDESYIIFEMAQKQNLSRSIAFADEVQRNLVSDASRRDRGVKQAGFWVLWSTSMPSVLVELDFICNPNSAKYMASSTGQNQLAEAIFKAVKKYYEGGVNLTIETPPSEPEANPLPKATEKEPRERLQASAAPTESKSKSRRRRSSASKAKSDNRSLEVDDIRLSKETVASEQVLAAAPMEETKPVVEEEKTQTKKSKNTKKEKQKASKKSKKVEQVSTLYKIQLLASTEQLSSRDPRFCGLSPISCFRENNLYKYTYGESDSKSEIDALLRSVKEKIPDAFVIKATVAKGK